MGDRSRSLRALAGYAERQRGLVTSTQLRALGLSAKQQDRLAAQGTLTLVRQGVYRCAGLASEWQTMVMAAVLVAGPAAVASHFTAAQLWGLTHPDRPAARSGIHVTAPGRVELAGVLSHRDTLAARDRAIRYRIPVTSATRTIVDITGDQSMGEEELAEVVDGALRRKLVRLDDLRAAMIDRGGRGRPPLGLLRCVVGQRDAHYDPGANNWERRMDDWWEAAALPPARRQYRTRAAGRPYIIDRAIVDLRIAVEWNGFATHGQTRSGFDATALRQLDLVSEGWAYIPVTTRTPPDAVCRAVWAAVNQRRAPALRFATDPPPVSGVGSV